MLRDVKNVHYLNETYFHINIFCIFTESNRYRYKQSLKLAIMTNSKVISEITNIVENERFICNRIKRIKNELNINCAEFPMGSGGVHQQKTMANGNIRYQIGYGHGKHNYAMCAII